MASQPSALLALDGPKGEAVLFVPDAPRSFGFPVAGVSLEPGAASARAWELDRVASWDELVPFLGARISEGVSTLYLDEARRPPPPGNPDVLAPMAGEHALWRRALPDVTLDSAAETIRAMRWVKSDREVAVLREVAKASVLAPFAVDQAAFL